jgi:hypothetical protein
MLNHLMPATKPAYLLVRHRLTGNKNNAYWQKMQSLIHLHLQPGAKSRNQAGSIYLPYQHKLKSCLFTGQLFNNIFFI